MDPTERHSPIAPRRDEIAGVPIVDHWWWLEDDEHPMTRPWLAEQTAAFDAYLADTDLSAILVATAVEMERLARVDTVIPLGEWCVAHQVDQMTGATRIVAGRSPDVLDRVLVDAATWPGESPAIDWISPSPSGTLLAFAVSERGGEDGTVHVVEIATGRVLDGSVPHTFLAPVAWLPDDSGFFVSCSSSPLVAEIAPNVHLFHLADGRLEPEPVGRFDDAAGAAVMPDGVTVLAFGGWLGQRPVAYRRLDDDRGWQPLLAWFEHAFSGLPDGDDLLVLTTDGAPRGRIVRLPLATARDRSTWRELVSEGPTVLRALTALPEHLVTLEIRDGEHVVRVRRADGADDHEVELPRPTGLDVVFAFGQVLGEPRILPTGPTTVEFVASSWNRPHVRYRYDVVTRELTALTPVDPVDESIEAELRSCTSTDGWRVDYWVVRERGHAGPTPALVVGYGGWGIAQHTPCYPNAARALLSAGATLILPQLRGGGEQGWEHWATGRLLQKQHVYDDLYAVVEDAVAAGIARADAVGFVGASNGGLTAGVAVTQRPDLWRAVISAVPFIDVLGGWRGSMGAKISPELGSLTDPAAVEAMAAYAPLRHVADGVAYPAVLVDVGDHDVRCPPWHGRKLAAALQQATSSPHPVLHRERHHGGHVLAEGRDWSVWTAFLIREFGLRTPPAGHHRTEET
jgi:prolyl oligopeptidase